jgi:hypothetical protein
MPRACTVCSHQDTAEITKALVAGGSKSAVAARFGLSPAAIQRHRSGCLRIRPRAEQTPRPPAREDVSGSVRFDSGDPASLVAATARLVDEALGLLEHAKNGGDHRTALAALREARDGLALLMRTAGLLTPDGSVTVNVDARRLDATLGQLSIEELRALARGEPLPPAIEGEVAG